MARGAAVVLALLSCLLVGSQLADAQSISVTVSTTRKKGLFYVFADGEVSLAPALS
jgi:hypothetical protein